MASSHRSWNELRPQSRALIIVGGVIQVGLLAAALADIRRRSAAELNGPRWVWVALSFVNGVGPICYFTFGRRRAPQS